MESTSIYWIPIWRVLSCDFDVKLVNPYFIKQLPGRETDVKDAHWIALVLQKELIKGNIPEPKIQELRQYERRMFYLNRNLRRAEQAMDLILQRCNIRFSNYVSDIGGRSMQKVIHAIIQGEQTVDNLLNLVHKRIRNKHGDTNVKASLTGIVSKADRAMLSQNMEEVILYKKQLVECESAMTSLCQEYFRKK